MSALFTLSTQNSAKFPSNMADGSDMKTLLTLVSLGLVATACQMPDYRKAPAQAGQDAELTTRNAGDDEFFTQEDDQEAGNQQSEQKETAAVAETAEGEAGNDNIGYAAWYGKELQGRPTASGELFDMHKFTAAHRDFPMGSVVLVENTENGKKQIVKVNDRGPYVEGRIIDVSYAAARDLGFVEKGVASVRVELIQEGKNDFLAKAQIDPQTDAAEPKEEKIEDAELQEEPDSKYTYVDGARPRGFTIQIGAFKKRANAERFRAEMEDQYNRKGFIASKGKWHYVWLGDFRGKGKAKKFFRKLRSEGLDAVYRGKV